METDFTSNKDFLQPVRQTWKKYKGLILVLVFVKMCFVVLTPDWSASLHTIGHGEWKQQVNRMLTVNNDELLIGEVALNYINGYGFVSAYEGKRKNYLYDFTAYRPTYPVYLHIAFMRVFQKCYPGKAVTIDYQSLYFKAYAAFLLFLSLMFFIVSLFYFRAIALLFLDEKYAVAALIAYAFYPSVLIYIGGVANYESIVTSMLIIISYLFFKILRQPLKKSEIATMILLALVSSLFRPQTNFIFIFLFSASFLVGFLNRKINRPAFNRVILLCFLVPLVIIIANVPVLIKNHRLFGAYTLSTSGFNFSLGHNPFARGGWCGNCLADPATPYYQYIRSEIKNYDSLDEYGKAHDLEILAFKWIREHPAGELNLIVRKTAIFFLPYNNDSKIINPFNLLVYAGALFFCFCMVYFALIKHLYRQNELLLLMPLAGSLAVSILFHVGFRWRYYAEPFMVICAVWTIQFIVRKIIHLKAEPNLK